ncbi:VOC family protein [Paenibacillaceae bacterium WGS1546]|uniref:VOC family protein n=1 Tax=Cohnella sp. WGS1546 TaxID=3366810 RepID=UPI00372D0B8A
MKNAVAMVSTIFIPVTDVKRSAVWYARMFDMETIELNDRRAGLTFPKAETVVILWKVREPQPVEFDTGDGKMHYFNFSSFDIHASYKTLQAKGAALSPIHELQGFRFFETYDPDRNVFNIVEETPESPYYAHKQRHRK